MTCLKPLNNTFFWHGAAFMVDSGKGASGKGRQSGRPLKELMEATRVLAFRGDATVRARSLITDSRRVSPGAVFFALTGASSDGNLFVEEAIDRGAVAIVSERPLPRLRLGAYIQVANARVALAAMARRFFNEPDSALELYGVTGTNGKTTVTTLLRHLLDPEGTGACGLIGTVNYRIGKRAIPAFKTTPESVDIYAMLDEMRGSGCAKAALEVSSHGIEQQRVDGLRVRHAAFLNLTRDHLDYHGTMERYFAVKRRLFTGEMGHVPESAAINIDDPYGARLLEAIPRETTLWTFGESPGARVRASDCELGPAGSRFSVLVDGREVGRAETDLPGRYNVSNVLAAIALFTAGGGEPGDALARLARFPGVPGRMEKVEAGQPFTVLVDYAHTDDALRNVLTNLRDITPGRVLVVFGCGGNRDRSKRPSMTRVVQQLADAAWATSDNPRREALERIFEDMREGVSDPERITFVEDRRRAISLALDAAREGDCVLLAGKGHETFQEFANTVVPFDDRQVARDLLGLKQYRDGGGR